MMIYIYMMYLNVSQIIKTHRTTHPPHSHPKTAPPPSRTYTHRPPSHCLIANLTTHDH